MENYKDQALYSQILRGLIVKLSKGWASTDEVVNELVQDAWLIIMQRNLPRPEWGDIAPSTWLFNVVREVITNQKRRRTTKSRSGEEISFSESYHTPVDIFGLTGPEKSLYAKEVLDFVDSAPVIRRPPKAKRSNLIRRRVEGYENKELASEFQISLSTVETEFQKIRSRVLELSEI